MPCPAAICATISGGSGLQGRGGGRGANSSCVSGGSAGGCGSRPPGSRGSPGDSSIGLQGRG